MALPVYERIKTSRKLPSPTGVALQVLQLAQDGKCTLEEIAAVVESDPATAARLLKLVNSALVGMPRQIASVPRAVALVGTMTVTSLALGFSLVSRYRRGHCAGFDYPLFWSDSLARAAASRQLVYRVKKFAPDEAFACALVSQIGRLALATAFPSEYADVLRRAAADSSEELASRERDAFAIDHDALTAEMMRDWHMPAIFCDAARAQSAPDNGTLEPGSRGHQFARILHLSGRMAAVMTRPNVYRHALSALIQEAARLNIDPVVYHEIFDAASVKWREAGEIFTIRTGPVPPLAEIYAQARECRDRTRGGPSEQVFAAPGERSIAGG